MSDARAIETEINRTQELLRRDPTEALQAFERQITEDPKNAKAHLRRSFALEKLGRLDDALIACFDRCQALHPEVFGNGIDVARRIECLIHLGDAPRALTECEILAEAHYPRFLGVPGESKEEIRRETRRRLGLPTSPTL